MAEPGKHRGGGVSSSPPRTPPAASTGRRRAPAGHRRRKRTFPAVPVAAGFFTIVAATSGVITLETANGDTPLASEGKTPQIPAGIALSVDQLRQARDIATTRSGRSGRDTNAVEAAAAEHARKSQEANERAAWEAERAKELAAQAESDSDTKQVISRVIRWASPLSSYRLSAGFGESSYLWSSTHTGQDFSAPSGTPVHAVGAGEVTSQLYDGSYGNKVVIEHADGTETWYCHLSSFGESGTVQPGDVIGYVGSTGNSTGPHLHLEVHPYGGDAIDPLTWLRELGLNI